MDEETEQWIPIDAIGLKSNNIRYTADDIQEAFDKASKDIKNVISTVDSGLTDITNTIGDISKIPAAGATIVDKVLNEFIRRSVNVQDFGAKGDGVTDDTEAFKAAFSSGSEKFLYPQVFIWFKDYISLLMSDFTVLDQDLLSSFTQLLPEHLVC
ncbi:glycosyl hydrolase family 28-related protein [Bacillus velezensis]|uniref:glycosyl hydrolase family 28-related protein n=1 Tax=Bacillus velezensis TaxID=492670 RepID=UPI003CFBA22E